MHSWRSGAQQKTLTRFGQRWGGHSLGGSAHTVNVCPVSFISTSR